MKNNPVIILVSPQMGENIGAAARAMKNFGLDELRIVKPRDGWPNEKANNVAVGAIDILDRAKIYDNLEIAIADLEYLYATTGVVRNMNKDYLFSKDLKNNYSGKLKTGIMFGRENSGLNNQEITLANRIITINTNDNFSSLNIAQALAIICYELFQQNKSAKILNEQELATKEQMGYFFEHLFTALDSKGFFKTSQKKPKMMQNMTNIFNRIDNLSANELQTLRGIISALTR